MDREELIERICPTDATYECGRGDCESNCQNCGVLLNALLDEYDKHIRADAERDFQNSDCWNDYLAKVIADTRTDERKEVIEILSRLAICEVITIEQYELIRSQIWNEDGGKKRIEEE